MNKIIKNKLIYVSTFLISFLLFSSCIVGLGPAIDLMAPEVTLDSHSNNDSVPESFVLYGTATDNEAVSKITISFEDAEMYYQIVPGESTWQKKNQKTGDWKAIQNDSNNYCKQVNGTWNWSVTIDTDDKTSAKTDSTFTFTIIVYDKLGNSTKKSKVDCSVVLDTSNPSVSIYKPELFEGTYESIVASTSGYETKDGNVISRLLNGDITFSGRISNSVSFKGMKIEFDNGKLKSGINKTTGLSAVTSIEDILNLGTESSLGDSTAPTVYYSKLIEKSDLKEWTLTVSPEEWATSESGIANGLNTGKHIIRVVTTALSSSGSWERKVVGYFLWYPEADVPWLTVSVGDVSFTDSESVGTECYPGSNISGIAQDDDEIQSFVTRVYKLSGSSTFTLYSATDYQNPVTHTISVDSPKYAAWTMKVPTETGVYKLEMELKDKTGNSVIEERYFKSSDVGAPNITITSPVNDTYAITNAEGNIAFKASAVDNTKLESFAFVWLNPKNSSDPNNKIKYLTGTDANWAEATEDGWSDTAGNKIFKIELNDDGRTAYLDKTYNLYENFGIDGEEVLLGTQDFIFRASDGVNTCVTTLTLSGDSLTPEVSFNNISFGSSTPQSLENNIPSFEKSVTGEKATITGTWSDKFTPNLNNLEKIKIFTVNWGGSDYDLEKDNIKADGTWEVKIKAPAGGGTITAKIQDYAGNSKTVQAAVNIETADLSLSRIGCENDDGAYKAGSEIIVTLNFSKNTDVELGSELKLPYLVLNNGGKAVYINETASQIITTGSGSTIHRYKYIVSESDRDVENLGVSGIVLNGAVWKDSKVENEFTFFKETSNADGSRDINLQDGNSLEKTRAIKIDNTKPAVSSINVLSSGSSGNYYKEGDSILLLLNFTENVTVTNYSSLSLNFAHGKSSDLNSATLSGSNGIIFTHKVEAGENTSQFKLNDSSPFINTGVIVTDSAGNDLAWDSITTGNITITNFDKVIIDTTPPFAPKFMNADGTTTWNPSSIILDNEGTSFTLQKQNDDVNSMEYSVDNGTTWVTYSGKVDLKNNGSYTVIARATDNAGNVSVKSSPDITFTIDKGELLSKITADTSSGSYGVGKTITGRIEFRKAVTIPKGAKVTLNIANSNEKINKRDCDITECIDSSKNSTKFTFAYTVVEGDAIDELDVIELALGNVTVDGKTVDINNPDESSEKRFKKNRTIKIDGIAPKISGTPSISGTTMTIEFDSAVSKGSGSIEIEYVNENSDNGQKFHVPAVLTASEYSELKAIFAAQNPAVTLSMYYEQGTNGAKVSGNTLVNDTSTKYTLKINKTDSGVESISDTDSNLVKAFITANKHKVTVPVIADEVTLSADNKSIKVELSSTYALPVKGANYSVTIPAGFVSDDVNNPNATVTEKVQAPGVEKPEIRIYKPSYSITNPGNTTGATVSMTDVQTATMFITCRTPGATINYGKTSDSNAATVAYNSNSTTARKEVLVHSNPINVSTTKTGDVTIPTVKSSNYTSNTAVDLGSDDSLKVNSFTGAQGLKIAITAQANKDGIDSDLSYEYATRTVVKFNLQHHRDAIGNTTAKNSLTFKDLRVWLTGGDSTSGPNASSSFPLAWSDSSKFKLMEGKHTGSTTDDKESMYGKWWWVSWDITSTTYIGFVIGDVPSDANTNGPTFWYLGDYHWTLIKEDYPLYPGECLFMEAKDETGSDGKSVSIPYGAQFSFNQTKVVSRE
ncbi:MAG: Ig-like domain repeat protein [Treponema sp.]|nr:Ig-like domain repeat protein [Treponema sp.]